MYESAKSKKELGFTNNKLIPIIRIKAIEIENFRTFKNKLIELGDNITVLIGRNGTMKTSLMGLIAHPFDVESSKDAFGNKLKTELHQVFRFSDKHDDKKYKYYFYIQTNKTGDLLKESVTIRYNLNEKRHRIVVSGHGKGDGNFKFNTSFLNLKRLLPLIDTKAEPKKDEDLALSEKEQNDLKQFYESILPSTEYRKFEAIYENNIKNTYAPTSENSQYDFRSISSGEDNLGAIFSKLIGFQRAYKPYQIEGNGILCIDEFESSLHPIAQLRLFKYLYTWSNKFKVQIILTTHSLHLIQHIYLEHKENMDCGRIALNFVSCSKCDDKNYPIIKNPDYSLAYKELTLQSAEDVVKAKKINIYCEDEIAIHFAKKLIKKSSILDLVTFHSKLNNHSDKKGNSYTTLVKLCSHYPVLLENSFALFDPDVTVEMLDKITNKDTYLVLPDPNNFAIERRIVCYIMALPKSDPFFEKFQHEKDWFLNKFTDSGITSLNIDDMKGASIHACKRWAENDIANFKKYITYYCNNGIDRTTFVSDFIKKINIINKKVGLPQIKEN